MSPIRLPRWCCCLALWLAMSTLPMLDVASSLSSSTISSSSAPSNGLSARTNNLLILGLGRVGLEVASQLLLDSTIAGTTKETDQSSKEREKNKNDTIAKEWSPVRFQTIFGTIRNTQSSPVFATKKNFPRDTFCVVDAPDTVQLQRIPFDVSAVQSVLPRCSHVLVTIPPRRIQEQYDDDENDSVDQRKKVFCLLKKHMPTNGWIGLISTTGVYGDAAGAWVYEDKEGDDRHNISNQTATSSSSSAQRYLNYEYEWSHFYRHDKQELCIFRCAGIYNVGQSALDTIYKRGVSFERTQQQPQNLVVDTNKMMDVTNRIHLTDLGRAVIAAMALHTNKPATDENNRHARVHVYNLADDLPESRTIVMQYAASLLQGIGIDLQERQRRTTNYGSNVTDDDTDTATKSERGRRRRTEQKRVSNTKMRSQLLPQEGLVYPTYKEGLTAILNDPRGEWWKELSAVRSRLPDNGV